MIEIDARGKPCPQPVILTREAIREGGAERVRVRVDSDVAAQNVRRMGKSQGWDATLEREGEVIHVVLTKGRIEGEREPGAAPDAESLSRVAEGRAASGPSDVAARRGQHRGPDCAASSGQRRRPDQARHRGRAPKVLVFVTSDLFGTGAEELGRILMRAFVKTIKDIEPRPAQLVFANSGVRLTTEGSDLIDDLKALEESGVEVISCGTCLDYYGLVEKLEVGQASNMFEIASALVGADRIVRP